MENAVLVSYYLQPAQLFGDLFVAETDKASCRLPFFDDTWRRLCHTAKRWPRAIIQGAEASLIFR